MRFDFSNRKLLEENKWEQQELLLQKSFYDNQNNFSSNLTAKIFPPVSQMKIAYFQNVHEKQSFWYDSYLEYDIDGITQKVHTGWTFQNSNLNDSKTIAHVSPINCQSTFLYF